MLPLSSRTFCCSWGALFAYVPAVPSKRGGAVNKKQTVKIVCTTSDIEGYGQCAGNVEFYGAHATAPKTKYGLKHITSPFTNSSTRDKKKNPHTNSW